MRFGSLFAGIGGFDLGLERAGMECRWQVEIDEYCRRVLTKHWPNVPKFGDIRTVHGIATHSESKRQRSGVQGNGNELERTEERRDIEQLDQEREEPACSNCLPSIELICGGFPCQPFSVAGKRRGESDDRFLWPEMLRVITECKPAWVVGENVLGIIGMALDQVLDDLEAIDYETQTIVFPAASLGAWHRRERVWILAHTMRERSSSEQDRWQDERARSDNTTGSSSDVADSRSYERNGRGCEENNLFHEDRSPERIEQQWDRWKHRTCEIGQIVPDSDSEHWEEFLRGNQLAKEAGEAPFGWSNKTLGWEWEFEPDVGRVAHGIPSRVDRLKGLGNAVVPQCAELIGRMIMESNLNERRPTRKDNNQDSALSVQNKKDR